MSFDYGRFVLAGCGRDDPVVAIAQYSHRISIKRWSRKAWPGEARRFSLLLHISVRQPVRNRLPRGLLHVVIDEANQQENAGQQGKRRDHDRPSGRWLSDSPMQYSIDETEHAKGRAEYDLKRADIEVTEEVIVNDPFEEITQVTQEERQQ